MMKWRNWKDDMWEGIKAAKDGCGGNGEDAERRRNRRLRRRGYFLSWAAKKEARMVPEMLW